MDELKELYGIEMSLFHKKTLAIMILKSEYLKTEEVLKMASNREQRIIALEKQKAIEYAISLLGETE